MQRISLLGVTAVSSPLPQLFVCWRMNFHVFFPVVEAQLGHIYSKHQRGTDGKFQESVNLRQLLIDWIFLWEEPFHTKAGSSWEPPDSSAPCWAVLPGRAGSEELFLRQSLGHWKQQDLC